MYNKQVKFLADEEIEKIIAVQTDKLNMSKSEYIRGLIKQDYKLNNIDSIADFKADLKTTIKELNAIGNNLNQLARYCNKEKKILETEQWEVRHLVDKLILIFNKL
jgi:Bacterial mobilisation protein (MobC).